MNLAQRVLLNTGVQLVARVAGLAVSLVVLRMTTNYLGIDDFGDLAIILAVGGLVAVFADLGLTTTLAREMAKAPEDVDELAGILLPFRLLSAAAFAVVTLAAIPFLPYSHQTRLGLAISVVGILFASIATFPNAFFQVNLRLELQAALDIFQKLLNLVVVGVVVVGDLGFYMLVALLAGVQGTACLAAFALSRSFWRVNLRFDWPRARPLVRDAIAIGIVSMVGLLHFKGDAVLLSLLKPAEDVGIYAVAYRFLDQAFVLPGLLVAAMFPILTRYVHSSDERLDDAVNRTLQVLVLAAIAVGLSVFVLAGPLVRLVSSTEFDPAVEPARILAFALLPVFAGPVFYNLLIAVNRQRPLIGIALVSLAFNVGLNLVLIPRWSYNGAAAATVASETLAFAGTFVVVRRAIPFRLDTIFFARALGATLAAVAAAAVLWGQSAWVAWLAAEAALLVFAYVFRAITRADLELILRRPGSAAA
jgi:O-antigen/teichoic acid export membrane protein